MHVDCISQPARDGLCQALTPSALLLLSWLVQPAEHTAHAALHGQDVSCELNCITGMRPYKLLLLCCSEAKAAVHLTMVHHASVVPAGNQEPVHLGA